MTCKTPVQNICILGLFLPRCVILIVSSVFFFTMILFKRRTSLLEEYMDYLVDFVDLLKFLYFSKCSSVFLKS